MTPDADRHPAAGLEPAASLTSVRVKRRKASPQPSGKRGDLTAESPFPRAAPPELPSAAVIVLPPPAIDRQAQQDSLPFAEVMLPELAGEASEALDEAPEPEVLALEPPALAAEAEPLDLLLWSASEREPAATEPEPVVPEATLAAAEPVTVEAAPDVVEGERDAVEAEPATAEAVELEPNIIEFAAPAPMPEPPPPLCPEPSLAVLSPAPPEEAVPAAPEDILDYWDSLRGGRDFPPLDELDRAHVAATWPNTVLLAIESQELPRITRLGENDGAIEYTANVIDWIMSRGRNSANRGEPMEEERRFPVSQGSARYRLLLLPFSSYGLSCDHVLCHLSRAPEISAVASFKRWLAS
jgi:hypothetical protein